MGDGRRLGRLARNMAVALVLAAVGALGAPHLLPGVLEPRVVQGQSDPVTETSLVTTVTGLDATTQYWLAVLGVRAPSESSPSAWFRWSNWGRASTLTTPTVSLSSDVTVAEGGTATLTVTAAPAPQTPLTVNYAIGTDDDAATVDGDRDDYTGNATGSIAIAAGATQGTIAVVIADDSDIDDGARETLLVTISLPEGSGFQLGSTTSATVTITEGVCDRTAEVRTAILDKLTDISACAQVTDADLSGITGTLDLWGRNVTALKARDFRGLPGVHELWLNNNPLTSLPADVFDGLTSLRKLWLHNNTSLASLPADVFDGLTSLQDLLLHNNALPALPADIFDGLTTLRTLRLRMNPGSPFTFTAAVEQTAATEVKVAVSDAMPFDLTATLAVAGGTLSASSVVVPGGSGESSAITVTPSGDGPVTISVTAASFPTSGETTGGVTYHHDGIQTGLGATNQAPTANAGADQTVDTEATVTLDAAGSSDPDTGDTLSYSWEQTAGTTVTLSSVTASGPTFTAPSSTSDLTFQVTVIDGKGGSDRDTVDITVGVVNQPPTFTSTTTTFSVAENTTAVGTVTATDPDAADSVAYALSSTDAALFQITTAGALAFKAAPNFEAPTGGADDDSNSYTLTVTATGGTGDRALTATQDLTVSVTDVNEAPGAPAAPTFGTATTTSLVVNWTAPANTGPAITDYDVQYRKSGVTAWTSLTHTGTARTATITSLAANTLYQIQVRAQNSEGTGGWSSSASETTVPNAPSITSISAPSSSSISLSWSLPSGPAAITGYDVQYRETGTTSWSSWSHSGTSRSATITGLDASTEHDVQVQAQNASGSSAWSATGMATTDEADVAPDFGTQTISNRSFVEDSAITAFALPAATGGNGTLTYSVSGLPAGLSFTASTRQVSGTPTAVGSSSVTYTATDADGDTATLTFDITVTEAPTQWQVRTFQGATGYWARLSWSAQKLSQTHGPNGGHMKLKLGSAEVAKVRGFVMNKDESGNVGAGNRGGNWANIISLNTGAGGASNFNSLPTSVAFFICGAGRFDTIGFAQAYASNVENDPDDGANLMVDVWDGSAWVSVGEVVDGSENAQGLSFGIGRDVNIDGSVDGEITFTAPYAPDFGTQTISNRSFVDNSAITAFALPAATGGNGTLTYSVSGLPAGLSFTASTRQVSGTPTAVGSSSVTYTATDADGNTATLTFDITVTEAPTQWQVRTFQGATGYWARLSWSAQKLSQTHGPNGGHMKLKLGSAEVAKVRGFVMNKDESGNVGAGNRGGNWANIISLNTGAGGASNFNSLPTSVAFFICGAGRFDTIGFAQAYASNVENDPDDGANLMVDVWDGSAWVSVGEVVDGSENAQGLSFGIGRDVNIDGSVDGEITFTAP